MEDSAKEPPPLGSYFSSPLPGMGPFCQSMKKSLTTLSVICYNAQQSQYFVETIFFAHRIRASDKPPFGAAFFAPRRPVPTPVSTVFYRSTLISPSRLAFRVAAGQTR